MAAWAGLFWFVLFDGRTGLYLSTRTAWVVPLGAVLASSAAGLRLASARTARAERLSTRESWMLGVVALPVVILLAMPPATLGTYAAGRRSGFVGSGVSSSAGSLDSGDISLIDVAAAQSSKEGQASLARHAGAPVIFDGLVTNEAGAGPGEFLLTRFIITCCVADATIAQVKVVDAPAGRFDDNEWVRVTGKIYPLGTDVLVDASSVVPIDQPQHPYLTP
jgi:putative membrane protein